MGSWHKVGAFLGLVPENGQRDEFGDEYQDGDAYPGEYTRERGTDYADDDFDRESPYTAAPRSAAGGGYEETMARGALAVQSRPESRREPESAGAIRPVTVKLTGFSEARVIGEKFREGKPVILDMTEMDDAGARRLVDFAAGLAFALRGSIDKVTTKVFMLLPPDTDVADMSGYEPAPAGFTGGFAAETPLRPAYAAARSAR
jgi:cell division inhibitor SepF